MLLTMTQFEQQVYCPALFALSRKHKIPAPCESTTVALYGEMVSEKYIQKEAPALTGASYSRNFIFLVMFEILAFCIAGANLESSVALSFCIF